jgi:hypothetical protein
MNLAPIEVTGGSDNQGYYKSLPDLFKANIPATDCTTPETSDPTIPNPGEFLIRASTYKAGAVTGPKCGAAAPDQNQNAQSGKVTNFAAYGPPSKDSNQVVPVSGASLPSTPATGGGGNDGMYHEPAATSAQASAAPTAGGNDGMYTAQPLSSTAPSAAPSVTASASSASSVAASSTFSTMTIPASSASAAPYPTLSPTIGQATGTAAPSGSSPSYGGASAPSGSSSSSSGNAGSSSGKCTTDGAVVCNGPTQFGLCNGGSVVWQAVAARTTCYNGVIQKRSQPVRRHAHGVHKVRAL